MIAIVILSILLFITMILYGSKCSQNKKLQREIKYYINLNKNNDSYIKYYYQDQCQYCDMMKDTISEME